jgi:hypothetical protein
MIRKILLAAMIATSVVGVATPVAAATYVKVAPPAPREEAIPAPRRGYVWAPGYWDWSGKRHVWHGGNWVKERRGYHYQESKWEERDGRWTRHPARWSKGDRDHDGVPNSVDRQPDNPRRN